MIHLPVIPLLDVIPGMEATELEKIMGKNVLYGRKIMFDNIHGHIKWINLKLMFQRYLLK